MKYEYLINYCTPSGIGRCMLKINSKIKSYDDIVSIDKYLRNSDNIAIDTSVKEKLFVTNFKLLRIHFK